MAGFDRYFGPLRIKKEYSLKALILPASFSIEPKKCSYFSTSYKYSNFWLSVSGTNDRPWLISLLLSMLPTLLKQTEPELTCGKI